MQRVDNLKINLTLSKADSVFRKLVSFLFGMSIHLKSYSFRMHFYRYLRCFRTCDHILYCSFGMAIFESSKLFFSEITLAVHVGMSKRS